MVFNEGRCFGDTTAMTSLHPPRAALPRHADMLGGEGPALHAILFHLAGGADGELRPPPAKGGDKLMSQKLMEYVKKEYGEVWRKKDGKLRSKLKNGEQAAKRGMRGGGDDIY